MADKRPPKRHDPLVPPPDASGLTDDHWLVREVRYWEATYDELRRRYLDLQEAHDRWREAHESLLRQQTRWEQWDADKRSRIEALNSEKEKLISDGEQMASSIRQWEGWYKSLENDRDKHKQWDLEKKAEIERLHIDVGKQLEQIRQWEAWYISLEADVRDLRERHEALLRDPFRYLKEALKRLVGGRGQAKSR